MECEHRETRIKHHATKHNKPFCTDLIICNDCGEILGLDSINLVSQGGFYESKDVNVLESEQ